MKKEVLIIASEFPPGPGGIGNHAFSMAKSLERKGFNVTVVASGDYVDKQSIKNFDSKQSFKIVRYSDAKLGLKYILRIKTVFENLKPNVILSGKFSLWMARLIKTFKGSVNVISILHGTEVNLPNKMLRKFTHKSIDAADHIVAVSNYTKSLLPNHILAKRTVHIIPNGIDLEELPAFHKKKELIGNPKILTVGNVTPRKGQHRVINALPDILKAYPNAHYHIVGLPTHKRDFYNLAKELGVENAVTFHGRAESCEDVCSFYYSADIFAILSENQANGDCEGFGIVILEAGYFGLPSIGATGCGIEDAIDSGYNGFLVDGNNPEQITNSISQILSSSEAFSKNAKAWAEKHDWNVIVDELIDLMK